MSRNNFRRAAAVPASIVISKAKEIPAPNERWLTSRRCAVVLRRWRIVCARGSRDNKDSKDSKDSKVRVKADNFSNYRAADRRARTDNSKDNSQANRVNKASKVKVSNRVSRDNRVIKAKASNKVRAGNRAGNKVA